MEMQTVYPKKLPPTYWDPLRLNYPVRKFPGTDKSSETIGRIWRPPSEVLKENKLHFPEEKEYSRDFNVTDGLTRSQTTLDYGYKIPETFRFNKHTSCSDNLYVYPPSKKLSDRTPAYSAHGTTEMKGAFTKPVLYSRLISDKDQYKHPASLPLHPPEIEPLYNEIEPLYTTHEGFEKHLDPYLSTNKLHHRPFTSEQLNRPSNTRDILTYYTYSSTPWVRSPKPNIDEWRLPLSKNKSMYDREKFNSEFREIRTHNKLNWVPRALLTEARDKYTSPCSRPESQIHSHEERIKSYYQKSTAKLQTNIPQQNSSLKFFYNTENSQFGLRKPICSVIDQFSKKNKKLDKQTTFE